MDFLAAVGGSRRPLVSGEDGVEALRVARAALESIRTKRVVEMNNFR